MSQIEAREQAEAFKGPGKFFCSAARSPACVREWKGWKCVRSSSLPAPRPHRSRMSGGWRRAPEEKPSLEALSTALMETVEPPQLYSAAGHSSPLFANPLWVEEAGGSWSAGGDLASRGPFAAPGRKSAGESDPL